jgi:hypothetical protein
VTGRTVGWLVWAGCTLAVLACLAGQLRRLPARLRQLAAYLPPPVQGLTETMVGAAAVTTTATPAADAALPPASAVDTAPPATGVLLGVAAPAVHSWQDAVSSAHPGATAVMSDRPTRVAETGPRRPTCVVRRGDTLFDLAAQYLGDGNRWPQIYRLNRGTSFPRVGGRLTDPDLIYPGWTLRLPHRATPPTGGPTEPRHRDTNRPDTAAPTTPNPRQGGAAPTSQSGTTPSTSAPTATAAVADQHREQPGVQRPAARRPDEAGRRR